MANSVSTAKHQSVTNRRSVCSEGCTHPNSMAFLRINSSLLHADRSLKDARFHSASVMYLSKAKKSWFRARVFFRAHSMRIFNTFEPCSKLAHGIFMMALASSKRCSGISCCIPTGMADKNSVQIALDWARDAALYSAALFANLPRWNLAA